MEDTIKKVSVVCGAGGFIGGMLSKRLIEQGHTVIGVDIKAHEYMTLPFHKFVIGDLRNIEVVRDIIPDSVDVVYQLAADMGGATYINTGLNDADVMSNSVVVNCNVLKVCVEKKAKKVFYSSSACVYPEHNQLDPNIPNCSEGSVYPADPDSEYGWEKLFSERLYKSFEKQYGLNVRIARFHNIYGPYGTYSGGKEKAPAALCRKVAVSTETIEVIGDGEQTRSFLYIEDCLDAVERLMNSDYKEPINIGSEEMVTINGLAKIIFEVSKKNLTIQHVPGPQGVRGRNSDNTIIERVLKWSPKYSLKDGIEILYKWVSTEVQQEYV